MWEALQSVIEKTAFKTVDDVSSALDQTIQSMQQREIDRRTAAELGSSHFFPPSSGEIARSAAAFVQQVTLRYEPSEIDKAAKLAMEKVQELGTLNRRREEFHGKSVLQAFYATHLHRTGLPKVVFSFETARHARRRRAVLAFFDEFFARLVRAKGPAAAVAKEPA
jgi:hypothetical protein